MARHARATVPLAPAFDTPNNSATENAFGSWHTNTIHFMVGDGVVKGFTPNMDLVTFRRLCNGQDGRSAQLP